MDRLLDAVLESTVRGLGCDRAVIMLLDAESARLVHGCVFGGAEEMLRCVRSLELPLEPGVGALAGVALSGEPLLVCDVRDSEARLDARLGGGNRIHAYTTSLCVLRRREPA